MAPTDTRKKNGTARGNLSEQVAVLRTEMESGHELILEKLKPLEDINLMISKLRTDVDEHTVTIAWWKGGQAVILFLLTAVLGFFGIHRH